MSGGESGEGKSDWSRGPRNANLARVSVHKLDRAARERGVRVEVQSVRPGRVQAQVSKTVVEGMPAPRKPWEKLFGKRG